MGTAEVITGTFVQILARMTIAGQLGTGSLVATALVSAVGVAARALARPVSVAQQTFVVVDALLTVGC